MIAGDLVSDKRTATRIYGTAESIAPLKGLKARIAKIAVPGNHDHWRGIAEVRTALQDAGFTVLQNEAAQVGPLAVGGLYDNFSHHDVLPRTLAAMQRLEGPRIVLSHSPDPFADLPPDTGLMLAGHTHCGQIGYPWGGAPTAMSRHGDRYGCGIVRERGNTLIASAGLGTSVLPFRLFVVPDVWRIKLEGP